MYSRPDTSDISVVTEKLNDGIGVEVWVGVDVWVGATLGLAVGCKVGDGERVGEAVGATGAQAARMSSKMVVIPIRSRFIGFIVSDGRISRKNEPF